jgi:hypothetical protein
MYKKGLIWLKNTGKIEIMSQKKGGK